MQRSKCSQRQRGCLYAAVFPASAELLAAARVYISDMLGLPSHYLIINSECVFQMCTPSHSSWLTHTPQADPQCSGGILFKHHISPCHYFKLTLKSTQMLRLVGKLLAGWKHHLGEVVPEGSRHRVKATERSDMLWLIYTQCKRLLVEFWTSATLCSKRTHIDDGHYSFLNDFWQCCISYM